MRKKWGTVFGIQVMNFEIRAESQVNSNIYLATQTPETQTFGKRPELGTANVPGDLMIVESLEQIEIEPACCRIITATKRYA